jgi:putative PIN family toxin of toxin-antitoxin system
MISVVLDTNVLVAAAYNRQSSSRTIMETTLAGGLMALVSPPILREYRQIIPRAVRQPAASDWIWSVVGQARIVHPVSTRRVVPADPTDDKFLAAARAGGAHAVVTNDCHLLEVGLYDGIAILRPTAFLQQNY